MLYLFSQFVFAELIRNSDTEHVEQRDKQFIIMRNNHLIRLIINVLVIVIDKPLLLYSVGVLESEE